MACGGYTVALDYLQVGIEVGLDREVEGHEVEKCDAAAGE